MLRFSIILFLVFTSISTHALQSDGSDFQPNANISDDLTVFIHTGSSRNYRIIGTILAGAPVTVLDRQGEPEFIQILDEEGRTGWIEAQYLSSTGSIRDQLPDLKEQVVSLEQQLSTMRDQLQQAKNQSTELEQQNKQITNDLEQARETSAKLQAQVDNADKSAMIAWFTRGGIVAVVCVFLGVLITYIPKKRGRNDQWM